MQLSTSVFAGALAGALLAIQPALASDAVRSTVRALMPDADGVQISASPMPGVAEVVVGLQVLYVSEDGEFILGGPMIRAADNSNLTESRVAHARANLLHSLGDLRTFNYGTGDSRHVVTVVTDIDCAYCRRLHNELSGYRDASIGLRYIMLPRAGKNSASYRKTVHAACAADPEATITAAMNGAEPVQRDCEHPIDLHMDIARRLQIGSTPNIILEDGRIVRGFRKPAELLELIERQ